MNSPTAADSVRRPPGLWRRAARSVDDAFVGTWRDMDVARAPDAPPWVPAVVVVGAALLSAALIAWSGVDVLGWILPGRHTALEGVGAVAAWRVALLVGAPIVIVVLTPGLDLSSLLFGIRGLRGNLRWYLIGFAVVIPLVIWASGLAAFQQKYPMYPYVQRSTFDLVGYELSYAAGIVAIEVFFRGFLVGPLAPRLGSSAVFVSVLPYVLIHVGKPPLEVLGSVIAGIFLATLAHRSQSIWGGAALHVGIAWSMDALALLRA